MNKNIKNIESTVNNIETTVFLNTVGRYYDDFECNVFEVTGLDIMDFVSRVVNKYSNYSLEYPSIQQALQAMEYLLFHVIPTDKTIRVAFSNWLGINKSNTDHFENVLVCFRTVYNTFKKNLNLSFSEG